MIEHLNFYAQKTTIPYGSFLTVLVKSFGIDVECESPTYLKPDNILSEQSLLRLSLRLTNGKVCFVPRKGGEKKKGKGKEAEEECDASDEEGSDQGSEVASKGATTSSDSEGDKEEEKSSNGEKNKEKILEGDVQGEKQEDSEGEHKEVSEGEARKSDSHEGQGTDQSEGEHTTDSESTAGPPVIPVFTGGLRRSKRNVVKPALSTTHPVTVETISSSDKSDPTFKPTQVPFAIEPSSIPVSSTRQPPHSPSPPPFQPTGFAAFSGTRVSVYDFQQVQADMEKLTTLVSKKLEEMASELLSLKGQVQALADSQATGFAGVEAKLAQAEGKFSEGNKEILETINRVAFEEVEEDSIDPTNPTLDPTNAAF
ncbi:uncharacterized protein LOC110726695 [Chenopodium quinoa]|uniref:uncharacterized protein LOC110726695 n=1 Tax=Chenopodium quinoa TaxID=63459 RepID=UPI000B77BD96|nr:uncharacterized protein LOC110726695 [Chenopodium quinoa]